MKKITQIVIVVLLIIYGFQLLCKFQEVKTPVWFSSYLSDLFALPLILSFTLIILRKVKNLPEYLLNRKMIVFVVCYVGVVFEVLLPQFSSRYTADFLDAIMYGVGGLLFGAFQKKLF